MLVNSFRLLDVCMIGSGLCAHMSAAMSIQYSLLDPLDYVDYAYNLIFDENNDSVEQQQWLRNITVVSLLLEVPGT
jgi:hypothetical protein